jgi:hypothetical protein
MTALAFMPIYIAFAAMILGFLLILVLGRARVPEERPAEEGKRGRATDHPVVRELEASVEKKAEFLVRLGFTEIDWIADEKSPGVTAFRARNPMPLAGGDYLIHFLAPARGARAIGSDRALEFKSLVKHEEGVLKGVLVTTSAFSVEAFEALANAPVELIDGKQVESLLRMFYPDRFPKDRI